MKKQSGFTLIELMVVMAIIAILATAGLSAYTGYIKKARDTTRIADIQAINTIVLSAAASSSDGLPPTGGSGGTIESKITGANNNILISDPINDKLSCLATGASDSLSASICNYWYQTCNNGTTYRILTRFESTSNSTTRYNAGSLTTGATGCTAGSTGCLYYSVGSCSTTVDTATNSEALAVIE